MRAAFPTFSIHTRQIFIGWRFFVLGAIYAHYPHIHDKYSRRIFTSLPTDAEIMVRLMLICVWCKNRLAV